MALHESLLHVRRWWTDGILQKQGRRAGLGCAIGSLISIGLHLATRDSRVSNSLRCEWSRLSAGFDGIGAYKPELFALGLGAVVVVIATPATRRWFVGYARAWWAGITSLAALLLVVATILVLTYWPVYSTFGTVIWLVPIAALFVVDFWRQQRRPSQEIRHDIQFSIPVGKTAVFNEAQWAAHVSDDPITGWADDIVGRANVVELLADHALRQRTPVVALHGGLGDGKSSVLNLLRNAVEGLAIVVSFNAWLPGSETTLASDVFESIEAECRRYIRVPQLRKRTLAFARAVSGSVAYLAGLRELIPAHSQWQEIQELRAALSRLPKPVLVLLDEIDRMQKEELRVLLKILRGAYSLPNVAFVCAFSEDEVKKILGLGESSEYLEKFFPLSISLSQPSPEMVGACLKARLRRHFAEQKWFHGEQDSTNFADLLGGAWADPLQKLCTNFRKAGLLFNDIVATGRPIAGEVNPLDLVLIEALRRFCPTIYHRVKASGSCLTDAARNPLFDVKNAANASLEELVGEVDKIRGGSASAVRTLLCWLFPEFAKASHEGTSGLKRPTSDDTAEDEKRICSSDYFDIYFRAVIPEGMFSEADLHRALSALEEAATEADAKTVLDSTLESIPAGHPRRADFLWKLTRHSETLTNRAAENLAYAVATRAADYRYDIFNLGEGGSALGIVLTAAQKLSGDTAVQRVLEGAIKRASDDTFAVRLMGYAEGSSRNRIFTASSRVDVAKLKRVFMDRMQRRYGAEGATETASIAQGDWYAFRCWAANSEEDRRNEQDFWRRFIGSSRKRLAEAIKFLYPSNVLWKPSPGPIVDVLFPLKEFGHLLNELPDSEELNEAERSDIQRMHDLLDASIRIPE